MKNKINLAQLVILLKPEEPIIELFGDKDEV